MKTILLLALASACYAEKPPVPGAWDTQDLSVICGQATGARRIVSAQLKARIYARDGQTKVDKICCEIDHIVPLELGGANALSNLWAQQWPDARKKDQLENRMHHLVCVDKTLSIAQAQAEIASDWEAAYLKYLRP